MVEEEGFFQAAMPTLKVFKGGSPLGLILPDRPQIQFVGEGNKIQAGLYGCKGLEECHFCKDQVLGFLRFDITAVLIPRGL